MIFIHNPLPPDRQLRMDMENRHNDHNKECDITRFVITGIFLYTLTSSFIIILNYPISLTAIVIPLIVLVHTIVVLRGNRRRNLWPCIFIAFTGFTLKSVAIMLFFIIYPLRSEEITSKIIQTYKKSSAFGWSRIKERAVFFGVLFAAEFILLILTCFLHWHLMAFCDLSPANTILTETADRTERKRRKTGRGHPL
ncbi:unnamed protein product [Thelazia callipaeda]|uniref:Uncharacterized protein n=1 Tax=Thelazia callipaeda TaxID=103827 RepID=A0A0N5D642_THECL|nr:unnamed protein product [Thelazia callipaeda]